MVVHKKNAEVRKQKIKRTMQFFIKDRMQFEIGIVNENKIENTTWTLTN